MSRSIPENLKYFLKNGIDDCDDGYEYCSELSRILHSDDCQRTLSGKELEYLREYAERTEKVGEINHYTKERIVDIEREIFGTRGIIGFLNEHNPNEKL